MSSLAQYAEMWRPTFKRGSRRASGVFVGLFLAASPACSPERSPAFATQGEGKTDGSPESQVAEQLVDGLFRVAPGEQIVLRGGPRYLPMMEAIAIEVLGAGGKAYIMITTDGERHYRAQRLPIEYLGPPPSSIDSALMLEADVEINLPYDSDFRSVWPDLESERFKRHQRSNPILSELNERSTRRYLYLAMPSQPEVLAAMQGVGVDSTTYNRLWWEAAAADIETMAERGDMIRRRLEAAKRIRVTTPDGTDFVFTPSDRSVRLDVARMSRVAAQGEPWALRQAIFPAGLVTVIPVDSTATGQVRAAADQCDQPVSREAFELRAGRPERIRAASGEACIQAGLAGAGMVGFLSIGLNPAMKPILSANGNYLPEQSLGLVSLGFGDNQQFGGTNPAPRWTVPLAHATVLADDIVIVRDGQFVAAISSP